MKSSKILGLAVAAILGSASSAFANTNLNDSSAMTSANTASAPHYIADELNVENIASVVTTGAKADFQLKYLVQTTKTTFARIELSNAKIATLAWTNTTLKHFLAGLPTPGVGAAAIALVQGGQVGDNFAIFEITAGAADIAINDWFILDLDGNGAGASSLQFTSSGSLTATVKMYNDRSHAQQPTDSNAIKVGEYSGVVVAAKSAFSFATKPYINTALVAKEYKEFGNGTGYPTGTTSSVANIGSFQLYTPDVTNTANGGTNVSVFDHAGTLVSNVSMMANNGTIITVKGDFTGASDKTKVVLSYLALDADPSNDGCAAPIVGANAIPTLAADKQSISFSMANGALVNGNYTVCYTVTSGSVIPSSGYTVDIATVAQANYVTTKLNKSITNIGTIRRDGVVLRSGFVSRFGIGVSRFIIANTGGTDATLNAVKFYGNAAGATVQPTLKLTLPYVLKANSRTAIEMADLVDLATMPLQNTMVELQIGAQDDNIFGTYQLLLAGSTVQTVVPMERPVSSLK